MIVIHTTEHPMHDYLHIVYLEPLARYLHDQGVHVKQRPELDKISQCTVLVDTEHLSQEACDRLKNNGCKIVGFNMVDSSGLAEPLRDHAQDCDLIFSLTGLQTTNIGHELEFDDRFQPKMVERRFLPEHEWAVFNMMRLTGRLLSLPYVHWERQAEPGHLPMSEKNGKVLVRGGAHMRRVVLAFFLMRAGLLDENSGFPTSQFNVESDPSNRFCQECIWRYHNSGRRYPYHVSAHSDQCKSLAEWGGDRLDLSKTGAWNNRCPRSFYWLADQFERNHGPISAALVEDLFNADCVSSEDHQRMLRRASFTSDLKWLHSIYVAQRFWDAAICGTVNYLPSRTMDQEYFPKVVNNAHFIAFHDDVSFVQECNTGLPEQYADIQNEAWSLYTQWIRPTDYRLNTNLLAHIMERITAI